MGIWKKSAEGKKEAMQEALNEKYGLNEVCIRLIKGSSLEADLPIKSPEDAVILMASEMSEYDREAVCVINLDTKLRPINYNIVSVGSVDEASFDIGNIFKSCILSNAGSFILVHNHPSGDPSPSFEDYELTRRVLEAGQLMGIDCLDHIVIGKNGDYVSIKEQGHFSFEEYKTTRNVAEKKKVTPFKGRKI